MPIRLFDLGLEDTAYPFLLFFSQAETEAVLHGHLSERGIGVERGVELIRFAAGAEDVTCHVRNAGGRTVEVRTRYLVGCDGAHSTVRHAAGIAFEGGAYPHTFVLADVEVDGGIEPDCVHAFMGRGNEPVDLRAGYDLVMITHRTITQTKSRTVANPWLSAIMPENGILIHPQDAERLGMKPGQQVRVISATNLDGDWKLTVSRRKPMIGKLVVTQTNRPGVISFALGFGHWATGSSDVVIDGHLIKGEKGRQAGIHANAAMWTDPGFRNNTCMLDPVGGSVSFYDTHVRLVPA